MKETYLQVECEKAQSHLLKYLPTWTTVGSEGFQASSNYLFLNFITKQSDTEIAEIKKLYLYSFLFCW